MSLGCLELALAMYEAHWEFRSLMSDPHRGGSCRVAYCQRPVIFSEESTTTLSNVAMIISTNSAAKVADVSNVPAALESRNPMPLLEATISPITAPISE